jgi:hypothetical protein
MIEKDNADHESILVQVNDAEVSADNLELHDGRPDIARKSCKASVNFSQRIGYCMEMTMTPMLFWIERNGRSHTRCHPLQQG